MISSLTARTQMHACGLHNLAAVSKPVILLRGDLQRPVTLVPLVLCPDTLSGSLFVIRTEVIKTELNMIINLSHAIRPIA